MVTNKINFSRGRLQDYQQIVPDDNTIYFLTDTHDIYFQNENYSKGIETITSIPLEGKPGVLYNYKNELYYYNNKEWIKITNNADFKKLQTDLEELLRRI